MIGALADELSFPQNIVMRGLLNPALTNMMLGLMGEQGRLFDTLLHNTISPTGLRASEKINVIPARIELDIDGRLLPGFTPDQLMLELKMLLGSDLEYQVIDHQPGPSEPDLTLIDTLGGILKELDPEGIPMPYFLNAVTDARYFSRLGIQTYGFLPMVLPPDFNFSATVHAADERVPVEAIEFGTNAVYQALQRFGG